MYDPKTKQVDPKALPEELQPVLELLAESVHDSWAAARIQEGWKWGPERNDTLKTHPGLVPYAELSVSEQEYDRITAAQTIQSLLDMGYTVVKKDTL